MILIEVTISTIVTVESLKCHTTFYKCYLGCCGLKSLWVTVMVKERQEIGRANLSGTYMNDLLNKHQTKCSLTTKKTGLSKT